MGNELRVSASHLKQLPLRGIVAFASRCARRVQPLVAFTADAGVRRKRFAAADTAIRVAERFAQGSEATQETAAVARVAERRAQSMLEGILGNDESADANRFSLRAAASAARAVRAASESISDSTTEKANDVVQAALDADSYASRASHAAVTLASVIASERLVSTEDFEKLLELKLGRFAEPGQTVDPSEAGPLGEFWLERLVPAWYRGGLDRMAQARGREESGSES